MLTIAILGEIGSGNFGDDIGFCVVRDTIYELCKKYDVVCNIEHLPPGRFNYLNERCYDIVISACGTLLDKSSGPYVTALSNVKKKGSKIAILGSGLSDPNHIEPSEEGQELFEEVLEECSYSWIRGLDGPDTFWLYAKDNAIKPNDKNDIMAFNFGRAVYTHAELPIILDKIENCIDYFKTHKDIKIVSCWESDDKYIPKILSKSLSLSVDGTKKTAIELNKYDTMIPFRGHLGVMATCCGLLSIPINFSTKVEDMYRLAIDDMTFLDVKENNWVKTIESCICNAPQIKEKRYLNVKKASEEVYNHFTKFIEAVI